MHAYDPQEKNVYHPWMVFCAWIVLPWLCDAGCFHTHTRQSIQPCYFFCKKKSYTRIRYKMRRFFFFPSCGSSLASCVRACQEFLGEVIFKSLMDRIFYCEPGIASYRGQGPPKKAYLRLAGVSFFRPTDEEGEYRIRRKRCRPSACPRRLLPPYIRIHKVLVQDAKQDQDKFMLILHPEEV